MLTNRSWSRTFAGMLLLILGLTCVSIVGYFLGRDASIWILGRHIDAEVTDLWLKETSEKDSQEKTFEYYISYQFTAPNGEVYDGVSRVSGLEWSALAPGRSVDVIYFPLYPPHNRLDDTRYIPIFACAYVPLVFVSLVTVRAGWHLIRSATAGSRGVSWAEILGRDVSP